MRRTLRAETEGAQGLVDCVDRTEARRLRVECFGDLTIGAVVVVHAVQLRVEDLRIQIARYYKLTFMLGIDRRTFTAPFSPMR